jgi:hypothetical protein
MKTKIYRTWACALLVLTAAFCSGCAAPKSPRNQLAGGYSEASITDEEVVAAAKYAVDEQAKRESSELHLISIRSSEQQVVAGMNYRLVLMVKKGTKEQMAKAIVYRDLKSRLSLTAWEWITDKP